MKKAQKMRQLHKYPERLQKMWHPQRLQKMWQLHKYSQMLQKVWQLQKYSRMLQKLRLRTESSLWHLGTNSTGPHIPISPKQYKPQSSTANQNTSFVVLINF